MTDQSTSGTERCETPACYREAVVQISGTSPIAWSDDDIDDPQWEDDGVAACVPCAAMFEQGAGSSPNEVGWKILDNPSDAGIEKLREVLLPKERTVNSGTDRNGGVGGE